jgi:DNA-binding LacI/PurR family transcriptional regulator
MNRPYPTLVEVARAAGVSRSTASNAFTHPERVRVEVRLRIEAAARALGYAGPDPRGRLLRSGKVHALGVRAIAGMGVADALRNPVYLQFLEGVGEVCDVAGANMTIFPDRPRGGVDTALIDGLILSRVEQLAEVDAARLRRLPLVVVDVDAGDEVSSVRVDAHDGAAAAARRLLDLGHRHFAIMSFLRAFGPPRYHPPGRTRAPDAAGMPIDQEKLAGYADALGSAGIAIDSVPIVQAHAWDEAAAAMLIDLAPEATAVLSMSVMQALAVVAEARRRGREVPRDLSVIGFNDIAAAADAGLTTVDGRTLEKGRAAARLVLEGGPVQRMLLPTALILRSSDGPAPV